MVCESAVDTKRTLTEWLVTSKTEMQSPSNERNTMQVTTSRDIERDTTFSVVDNDDREREGEGSGANEGQNDGSKEEKEAEESSGQRP
jgi:hypothetical protein